jgi:hypothetical protein
MIKKLSALFLVLVLASGCSAEPRTYPYNISVAGGPGGWPIWLERVVLNGNIRIPGGINEYGFDQTPPSGSRVVMDAGPLPEKLEARWFSHRSLAFYEAFIELPESLDKQLNEWFTQYPASNFSHYLIVGFSGRGEYKVWWRAVCKSCKNSDRGGLITAIIESGQAERVPGQEEGYRPQVEQFVDEGVFPSPWSGKSP